MKQIHITQHPDYNSRFETVVLDEGILLIDWSKLDGRLIKED